MSQTSTAKKIISTTKVISNKLEKIQQQAEKDLGVAKPPTKAPKAPKEPKEPKEPKAPKAIKETPVSNVEAPPKKKRVLSEEHKQKLRERLVLAREAKAKKKNELGDIKS